MSQWSHREGYFLKEALSQRTLNPCFNVINWTPFKSGPHSRGRTADAQKMHEVNTTMFRCLPRPWPRHEQGGSCRERGPLPRELETLCQESQGRPHEKGCGSELGKPRVDPQRHCGGLRVGRSRRRDSVKQRPVWARPLLCPMRGHGTSPDKQVRPGTQGMLKGSF